MFPVVISEKYLRKAQELKIDPDQITEKAVLGGGAGGQKVNKTASAVFLKYSLLDITVKCQKYREWEKNRMAAYKLLITKIENLKKGKESEQAQKNFKLRKQKKRRSRRAKEKMLEAKRHQSEKKLTRRKVDIVN